VMWLIEQILGGRQDRAAPWILFPGRRPLFPVDSSAWSAHWQSNEPVFCQSVSGWIGPFHQTRPPDSRLRPVRG
jgi:hypothetical protein